MEQRTSEWFDARLGKITASNAYKILSKGQARQTYMMELLVERIQGAQDHYSSPAMIRGSILEEKAKELYAFKTGEFLEDVGFINHPIIDNLGASPDSLVSDDGLIEVKCLLMKQHLNVIISNKIPNEYQVQMETQMACTGRKWCDFVCYHPDLKNDNGLFIKRVARDEYRIKEIELNALFFIEELNNLERKINECE